MKNDEIIDQLTNAFLRWPLPESVCADLCATKQQAGRVGTNLLSYVEAKKMMEDLVLPVIRTYAPQAGAVGEVEVAVSEIVCRRYLCNCCSERRDAGLKVAAKGARAFLEAVRDHQGMICANADWVIDRATNALSIPPPIPPTGNEERLREALEATRNAFERLRITPRIDSTLAGPKAYAMVIAALAPSRTADGGGE